MVSIYSRENVTHIERMGARSLLQSLNAIQTDSSSELSPEATAGFILGFVIVGFALVLVSCYMVFLTSKVKVLGAQLALLEKHPKLQKTEADME